MEECGVKYSQVLQGQYYQNCKAMMLGVKR
jgi:hypothetical protein